MGLIIWKNIYSFQFLSVTPISLFFGVIAVSCKTNQPSSTYLNNQSIDVSFKTNPALVLTNENEYELVINITNANNKTLVASLTKKVVIKFWKQVIMQ